MVSEDDAYDLADQGKFVEAYSLLLDLVEHAVKCGWYDTLPIYRAAREYVKRKELESLAKPRDNPLAKDGEMLDARRLTQRPVPAKPEAEKKGPEARQPSGPAKR